jgi:hypothetical protein
MLSRLATRGQKHCAAVTAWDDAPVAGAVGFHGETRRTRAEPRTEHHLISRSIPLLAESRAQTLIKLIMF